MFEEMFWEIERIPMREGFGNILSSSRMEIPPEVEDSVLTVLEDLFEIDSKGTFKRPSKDFGNDYNSDGSRSGYGGGFINIMPSTRPTRHISDTLVVYCIGGDNLNNRLADMLIEVAKHGFKNVFFVTSKWDVAAVTGNNIKRLQDLYELRKKGSNFCFILGATSGISRISVI